MSDDNDVDINDGLITLIEFFNLSRRRNSVQVFFKADDDDGNISADFAKTSHHCCCFIVIDLLALPYVCFLLTHANTMTGCVATIDIYLINWLLVDLARISTLLI